MSILRFKHRGSFKNTEAFLKAIRDQEIYAKLDQYGQKGVDALSAATPELTGLAATSWYFDTSITDTGATISWYNSNIENGFPVAVMIQYGHGTGTGGYVQGRDYINPALRPIFDEILDNVWKAVTSA